MKNLPLPNKATIKEQVRDHIRVPNKSSQTKNRRQQLPMPTDIQDYLFNSETVSLLEKAQESFMVGQDNRIRHLSGKYERFYLDESQKVIHKELVNIHTDGRVIVRSQQGIQKGMAMYFMNATLAINILSLNDDETMCQQILSYTGRFDYQQLECLYSLCTTINAHNVPIARQEVLIPADTFGALPELIKIESQAFFKLNYKYPHLLKNLQSRQLQAQNKVTW